MEHVLLKGYSIKELEPSIQEKIISNYHDILVFDDWYIEITDAWKEKLEAFGFENPKIFFSGFYAQGDGACFTCDNIDINKLSEVDGIYDKQNPLEVELLNNQLIGDVCGFKIYSIDNRYCHENTKRIEWLEYQFPDTKEAFDIHNKVEAFRKKLCYEIYDELEKEYDLITSDKAIIEELDELEYLFTIDGKKLQTINKLDFNMNEESVLTRLNQKDLQYLFDDNEPNIIVILVNGLPREYHVNIEYNKGIKLLDILGNYQSSDNIILDNRVRPFQIVEKLIDGYSLTKKFIRFKIPYQDVILLEHVNLAIYDVYHYPIFDSEYIEFPKDQIKIL